MPEGERVFLDTNVVLYALGTEEPKRTIAQNALNGSPIISTQVLSEAASVLHRKYGVPKEDVVEQLEGVVALVEKVTPIDKSVIERAWDLWRRHPYHWFDSLILASSISAGCSILYSEDFQHEQTIEDQLTIVNPFLAEVSP